MIDALVFLARSVSAFVLLAAAVALSAVCADALVGRSPVGVRLVAMVVSAFAIATLSFHLLRAFGQFNSAAATAVAIAAVAGCRHPARRSLTRLVRQVRTIRCRVRALGRASSWVGVISLLSVGAAIVMRALLVPPLGWDTLTYHGVKTALWVQRDPGGLATLPGGWSIYQLYPGGAELLRAWVMLPFHGDFAVAAVDVVEWLALGLAVWCLCRLLQLTRRIGALAAIFVMLTPTVARLVGSGYSDLTVAFTMTAGVLFGTRFIHSRRGPDLLLAVVAFALAIGAKFSATLPATAAIGVLGVVAVGGRRVAVLRWAAGGLVLAGALVAPWMLANVAATGYPLSPIPVAVLGTTLGKTNRAMSAYLGQAGAEGRTVGAELKTLVDVFAWPPTTEALGLHTLPLVVGFPFGLAALIRRRPSAGLLIGTMAAGVVVAYYNPGLAVVRATWGTSSSRFLIPLVALGAPLTAMALRAPRHRWWLQEYLTLGVALNATFIALALGLESSQELRLATLASLVAIVAWLRLPSGVRVKPLAAVAVTGVLLATWHWKEANRYTVAANSYTLHPMPKYAIRAAATVDEPSVTHVVAVTAGEYASADNQFLYYFFGRRFQNRLVHVPVPTVEPGESPGAGDAASGSSTAGWIAALRARNVDYVVSLAPAAPELPRLEATPDAFVRLAGTDGEWGVFRVLR